MAAKLTLNEFIRKAKKIHGDKYDYSKVDYVNSRTKVCIICPKHGEFLQLPYKHLSGHNCQCCNLRRKNTTADFISKAKEIHDNKYDYSKVNYVNNHTKVCIICSKHGEFWQTPHNHLCGNGCSKCSLKYQYTTSEIINKFVEKHGDKYDYSNVLYRSTDEYVCIICPKHGEFWQQPYHHIGGNGCPNCSRSLLEEKVSDTLDILKVTFFQHVNQKMFPWLKKQHLDFYLPEYNIAIECQGEQHYKPVDFAGLGKDWAKKLFNKIQLLDKQKAELCKMNGLTLNYIGFNENVEEKIKEILIRYDFKKYY